MASSNINEKVQQALEEGHPWEDIKAHLSTLDNPEAKSYLSGLKTATSSNSNASNVQTGLIDWAQANPQEALLYGGAAYAALQAPKIASKVADYRLKQRELNLKERSLAAYESQVAKQGAPVPEMLNPQDELINSVRQNEFEQQKTTQPTQPTPRELKDQIALERERLKLEQDKIKHENFVRQNQWSPEEIALGRRIKTPAEMQIAKTVIAQQAAKTNPVVPTPGGPAPVAELPITAAPVAPENVSLAPVAPTTTPVEVAPTITQPANVVSTGPTAESAEAPIKQAEVVKEAVTPTAEKTKAKTEPKIPKPEFFKNAPSAERWMYGSMTKYMDQPISAQAVVARAADYLPEGTKFEMQPGGEGGGIHPEQKPHLNRFVSEQLGIPLKEGKLPDDFKFTTENRNKLAASVQTELETHAKAGTLGKLGKGAMAAAALLGISEAVKAAQKGDFGPLKEAGFDVGLAAIPNPALQAAITSLTGTTLQPGTLPSQPFKSFESTVLSRKGVKEELEKLTKGKTGAEFNAIRDQYLYSNPRAVSDYDRAVKFFQSQAKQPVVPR